MFDAQIIVFVGLKDLAWLNPCLRSIQKYWSGEYPPIVVIPPEFRNRLPSVVSELRAIVILQPPRMHDYVKMTADCYICSHMVLFLVARCMFTKPCSFATFTDAERHPILCFDEYAPDLCRPGADHSFVVNRRSMVEDLLDVESPYEYTGMGHTIFNRHSIRRAREIIESKNKRPLLDIILRYSEGYFSSENFLGSHVWNKERDSYRHIPHKDFPDVPIQHFRGITDPTKGEDLMEVQRILA